MLATILCNFLLIVALASLYHPETSGGGILLQGVHGESCSIPEFPELPEGRAFMQSVLLNGNQIVVLGGATKTQAATITEATKEAALPKEADVLSTVITSTSTVDFSNPTVSWMTSTATSAPADAVQSLPFPIYGTSYAAIGFASNPHLYGETGGDIYLSYASSWLKSSANDAKGQIYKTQFDESTSNYRWTSCGPTPNSGSPVYRAGFVVLDLPANTFIVLGGTLSIGGTAVMTFNKCSGGCDCKGWSNSQNIQDLSQQNILSSPSIGYNVNNELLIVAHEENSAPSRSRVDYFQYEAKGDRGIRQLTFTPPVPHVVGAGVTSFGKFVAFNCNSGSKRTGLPILLDANLTDGKPLNPYLTPGEAVTFRSMVAVPSTHCSSNVLLALGGVNPTGSNFQAIRTTWVITSFRFSSVGFLAKTNLQPLTFSGNTPRETLLPAVHLCNGYRVFLSQNPMCTHPAADGITWWVCYDETRQLTETSPYEGWKLHPALPRWVNRTVKGFFCIAAPLPSAKNCSAGLAGNAPQCMNLSTTCSLGSNGLEPFCSENSHRGSDYKLRYANYYLSPFVAYITPQTVSVEQTESVAPTLSDRERTRSTEQGTISHRGETKSMKHDNSNTTEHEFSITRRGVSESVPKSTRTLAVSGTRDVASTTLTTAITAYQPNDTITKDRTSSNILSTKSLMGHKTATRGLTLQTRKESLTQTPEITRGSHSRSRSNPTPTQSAVGSDESSSSSSATSREGKSTVSPNRAPTDSPTAPVVSHVNLGALFGILAAILLLIGVLVASVMIKKSTTLNKSELDNQLDMPASKYKLVQQIGKGAVGDVYLIKRRDDGTRFAMKYILCQGDEERNHALAECAIVRRVRHHDNIVPILDVIMSFDDAHTNAKPHQAITDFGDTFGEGMSESSAMLTFHRRDGDGQMTSYGSNGDFLSGGSGGQIQGNDGNIYDSNGDIMNTPLLGNLLEAPRFVAMVMQYFPDGDLAHFLRCLPEDRYCPEHLILDIAIQLSSVLAHLADQKPPIIHRDIKPENLLLNSHDGKVMLTDFGIALEVKIKKTRVATGTFTRTPPLAPSSSTETPKRQAGAREIQYGGAAASSRRSQGQPLPSNPSLQEASQPMLLQPPPASHGHSRQKAPDQQQQPMNPSEIILTDVEMKGSAHYSAPETWHQRVGAISDIWSLGCVLYAVATKRVTVDTARHMSSDVHAGDFAEEIRKDLCLDLGYSSGFADLVLSCLATDPKDRPTALTIHERARGVLEACEQEIFDLIEEKIRDGGRQKERDARREKQLSSILKKGDSLLSSKDMASSSSISGSKKRSKSKERNDRDEERSFGSNRSSPRHGGHNSPPTVDSEVSAHFTVPIPAIGGVPGAEARAANELSPDSRTDQTLFSFGSGSSRDHPVAKPLTKAEKRERRRKKMTLNRSVVFDPEVGKGDDGLRLMFFADLAQLVPESERNHGMGMKKGKNEKSDPTKVSNVVFTPLNQDIDDEYNPLLSDRDAGGSRTPRKRAERERKASNLSQTSAEDASVVTNERKRRGSGLESEVSSRASLAGTPRQRSSSSGAIDRERRTSQKQYKGYTPTSLIRGEKKRSEPQ